MPNGPAPTAGAEPVDPPPPPSAPTPEDADRPTADFSLFNTRSLFRA